MEVISSSAESARRLAITKQNLAGPWSARANKDDILSVVRKLAYIQWDPINIVAPSHIISLWSRVGNFRLSDLDRLLWDEKKLFEHWIPIASIVLTEDYPIYRSLMERYPASLSGSWKSHEVRARRFLAKHAELRRRMLKELKKGPLQANQFTDYRRKRSKEDWTPTSDVSSMLFLMHMSGEVMVVGHEGQQNVWGTTEEFLPDWVSEEALTEDEFEREASQRAIRALGTAIPREINYYFPRGRYRKLKSTLSRLQEEGVIHRIDVEGIEHKEERFIHKGDISLLESMPTDAWKPRMSLIAPFDNLIAGRERTNRIFGFDYLHEQFIPPAKRKFGTYVLPILWGERLIGRTDLQMDRRNDKLMVKSVHAEPGAPKEKEVGSKINETIQQLGDFLGATEVAYASHVPAPWASSLR